MAISPSGRKRTCYTDVIATIYSKILEDIENVGNRGGGSSGDDGVCYCCFSLTTLIDVTRTLEYLAHLGYMYEHDNQLSAIYGELSLILSSVVVVVDS